MARQLYGAGTSDFTTDPTSDIDPFQPVVFWRVPTGGSVELAILPYLGTAGPAGVVYSDDDGRVAVYGPDGFVGDLWVSRAVLDGTGQLDVAVSGSRPRYRLMGPGTGASNGNPSGSQAYSSSANVRDYGAAGDGVADDTTAIQSALNGASEVATIPDAFDGITARTRRQSVVIPGGLYRVTATMRIPLGVDLVIEPGAIVRAGGAMGPIFETPLNQLAQDQTINCRGLIDCANLASVGIYARYFSALNLLTPRIYSPTEAGVVLGDPAAPSASSEARVTEAYVWRPNGQAVPAGSVGIWLRNVSDSTVGGSASTIVGAKTGVRNDGARNSFDNVSVSGHLASGFNSNSRAFLSETGFLDLGRDSVYVNCTADSPTLYGWRITEASPRVQLFACGLFNRTGQSDNTATALHVDSTAAPGDSVLVNGFSVVGAVGARVARDFGGNVQAISRTNVRARSTAVALGSSALAPNVPSDLHEAFISPDGSAPNTVRWTVGTGGDPDASATIQGNRLRLRTGNVGSYSALDYVTATTALTGLSDAELLLQIEYGDPALESYFWAGVRCTTPNPISGGGYYVETSGAFGYITFNKRFNGAVTVFDRIDGLTLSAGSRWWLRIRTVGSSVSWSAWPDGSGSGPVNSFTDTSITGPGLITTGHGGGQAPASADIYLNRVDVYKR